VASQMADPEKWCYRAASLWSDWLKLCLLGCLLKQEGVCKYSAPSAVNSGPHRPVDRKHSGPRKGGCSSRGDVTRCGTGQGGSGMGGIQGFPARASRIAVMTLVPCLAAVSM
jgi:hypothetical protein